MINQLYVFLTFVLLFDKSLPGFGLSQYFPAAYANISTIFQSHQDTMTRLLVSQSSYSILGMDIKKKRRVHFSELEADVSEDRGEQKDKETAMKSCIIEVWQKPVEMWMMPLKDWRNPMMEWEKPICTWLKSNSRSTSTQEVNSGASIL